MLVNVNGRDTASVVSASTRLVGKLPMELRRSLTWDRGGELAGHKQFTIATDVKVFLRPSKSLAKWHQRNTNGLLGQYFPKGTELSIHCQVELTRMALRLNQRPRKTLGFVTPACKPSAAVALTG